MSEETQPHKQRKSFYKEWVEPLLIAAVIALFIRQFVVEAFKIPSGSMIPTLTIGDHLLVNKFVYGSPVDIPFTNVTLFHMPGYRQPRRGEVIVFKYPLDEQKNFIKRVVGVPGDKIQIISGKLFINDQPVPITPPDAGEVSKAGSYEKPLICNEQLGTVNHRIQYLMKQSDKNFGPKLVPEDSVFVMGDNRDNSQDSRVWGFVRLEKILGRAFIIYWSWDGDGRWVRWERIGKLIQ